MTPSQLRQEWSMLQGVSNQCLRFIQDDARGGQTAPPPRPGYCLYVGCESKATMVVLSTAGWLEICGSCWLKHSSGNVQGSAKKKVILPVDGKTRHG